MLSLLHALSRASSVRFVIVGLAMTAVHLALFRLVSVVAVAEVANLIAFVVVTQLNFAVSHRWTWASRGTGGRTSLFRRAVAFNGAALVAFGANAAVFSLAHRSAGASAMTSALVAAVVGAGVSFLLSARLVFARRSDVDPAPAPLPSPPVTVPRPASEPVGRVLPA